MKELLIETGASEAKYFVFMGIILIVTGFAYLLINSGFGNSYGIVSMIIGIIITVLSVTVIAANINLTQEKLAKVEHYYLDGEEVGKEKINLNFYELEIDGDTCYLAKKTSHRNTVFIPIIR